MPDKKGEELFYLDDAGNKQDRELHAVILGAVDKRERPVDETIMGPIREKHRKAAEKAAAEKADKAAQRRALWARLKAEAQARAFNPNQPRDEDGKWTDGGGSTGAPSAIPGYKPGVKASGKIEKFRDEEWIAKSPIKTIDDIVRAAPIAQKSFADAGDQIAKEMPGVEFMNPGAKTHKPDGSVNEKGVARTKTKIKDREGVTARVTDTARGAFVISHPDQAAQIVLKLSKTHEVLVEDWRTIHDSYYTDRALLFRDRATGLIGEVQIMDPAMWKAKKEAAPIYDATRELPKGDPVKEAGSLKMRQIYGPVLDGYRGSVWASVDHRHRPRQPAYPGDVKALGGSGGASGKRSSK